MGLKNLTLYLTLIVASSSNAFATPDKIVGPGECKECHKNEYNAWRLTKHSENYKALPKLEEAIEITKKLGMTPKDIRKEGSICLDCHYTVGLKGKQNPKPRAIAGNSCESCHGPAKDWLVSHQCYVGNTDKECLANKDVKSTDETEEHKVWRLTEGRAERGMLQPSDIYAVANNCFQCHTVPNERLVNEGGHTAGSAAFDLVAWSGGEVRHNFFRPPNPDKTVNVESEPGPKNVMYVAGAMLDLEHSLRGLAKAEQDGNYSQAMIKRIGSVIQRLDSVKAKVNVAQVEEILKTVGGIELKHGDSGPITAAAESVAKLGRSFADEYRDKGNDLAGVAGLIPAEYKGNVHQ